MWQSPTSKVVQAKQASEVQVDVSELNTKYQPTRPLWTERSDSNVKRKSSFRIGSLRTNVISLYPYTCLPSSICPLPLFTGCNIRLRVYDLLFQQKDAREMPSFHSKTVNALTGLLQPENLRESLNSQGEWQEGNQDLVLRTHISTNTHFQWA